MKTYRITATCDPYNARFHYNGEEVIRYNMVTPVEWVIEKGLTEEEALEKLSQFANSCEDLFWYDDEEVKAYEEGLIADGFDEYDVDTKWYKGPGYYSDEHRDVYLIGETSFRDDSMFYQMEEE